MSTHFLIVSYNRGRYCTIFVAAEMPQISLQELGLLKDGAIVVADNVLKPGDAKLESKGRLGPLDPPFRALYCVKKSWFMDIHSPQGWYGKNRF